MRRSTEARGAVRSENTHLYFKSGFSFDALGSPTRFSADRSKGIGAEVTYANVSRPRIGRSVRRGQRD
ncbi:hypothetical protein LC55x_0464 [Lysobacter capsici]|nr:hypothetical protein LC55x_0464 [Lysobacter capsici]